ncbi:MAG: translation elongation factor-like protein [Candidatus Omnitrophota bacterium]|nr:MAG: translation elongation factor-like protein [Candidatus Omnitrophota bacterium]
MKGKEVGIITHYFPQVRAAVVKMKAPLAIGDSIKIKGHTTDFTQNVSSMQIDRVPISVAKKGQEIGLLVESRVRGNDVVYKV